MAAGLPAWYFYVRSGRPTLSAVTTCAGRRKSLLNRQPLLLPMKPLLWLLLFTGCAPLRAWSQGPDPIYGLGICTSGNYLINQAVAPTSGPGPACCVPAANDPGLRGFPGCLEEGFTGFVNGDPAGRLQHISRGDGVTLPGRLGCVRKRLAPFNPRSGLHPECFCGPGWWFYPLNR